MFLESIISVICFAQPGEQGNRPLFIKNQITLGTNVVDYINLATLNIEGSLAISRHWTLNGGVKLNPWTFNKSKDNQFQNRHFTAGLGFRWWHWYVNSGWFIGSSLKYMVYNYGGLFNKETYQGEIYGLNGYLGYSLMLNKGWNVEFAAGVLGGYNSNTKYICPKCGVPLSSGEQVIIIPDNILVQFVKVF